MASYTFTNFPKKINDRGLKTIKAFLTRLIDQNPLYSECELHLTKLDPEVVEGYVKIKVKEEICIEFQLCKEWFCTRACNYPGYPVWIQRSLHKFFHNKYKIEWIPEVTGMPTSEFQNLPNYLGKSDQHTESYSYMVYQGLPARFRQIYEAD